MPWQAEPDAVAAHGLPALPLPVRADRSDGLIANGEVQLGLLADEVSAVLEAAPELLPRYAAPLARIAFLAGLESGHAGIAPAAEHYFALGLQLSPQNASLRAHHGLALLGLDRLEEAYREFLIAMAHPQARFSPGLWLAAARTASALGRDAEAVKLLEQYAFYMPAEPEFWDLLADYRAKAQAKPPRRKPSRSGA